MVNTKLQCKVIKQLVANLAKLGGCPACAEHDPKLEKVDFSKVATVRYEANMYDLESDDPDELEEGTGEFSYSLLDEDGKLLHMGGTHLTGMKVETEIKEGLVE